MLGRVQTHKHCHELTVDHHQHAGLVRLAVSTEIGWRTTRGSTLSWPANLPALDATHPRHLPAATPTRVPEVEVVRIEATVRLELLHVQDRQDPCFSVIRLSPRSSRSVRLTCTSDRPIVSATSVWVNGNA